MGSRTRALGKRKRDREKFDIPQCNAINIVSYILSDVKEIECETKSVPNQLEGRGCQCQRMIKVSHIDPQLYSRLKGHAQGKSSQSSPEKLATMILMGSTMSRNGNGCCQNHNDAN